MKQNTAIFSLHFKIFLDSYKFYIPKNFSKMLYCIYFYIVCIYGLMSIS